MPEIYEIQSREVQEVMSKPPSWPIAWGNLTIFFLVVVGTALLMAINIPQMIRSNGVLLQEGSGGEDGQLHSTIGYHCLMPLAQEDLSKIEIGMSARIELVSFPARQYGYLEGSVMAIADSVNADQTIDVSIAISPTLKNTSIENTGKLRTGLAAKVEIETGQINFLRNVLLRN